MLAIPFLQTVRFEYYISFSVGRRKYKRNTREKRVLLVFPQFSSYNESRQSWRLVWIELKMKSLPDSDGNSMETNKKKRKYSLISTSGDESSKPV